MFKFINTESKTVVTPDVCWSNMLYWK